MTERIKHVIDVREPDEGLKDFAIMWFRGCNSGIILKSAKTAEEACKHVYSTDIVQHVAFEIPKGCAAYSIGTSRFD